MILPPHHPEVPIAFDPTRRAIAVVGFAGHTVLNAVRMEELATGVHVTKGAVQGLGGHDLLLRYSGARVAADGLRRLGELTANTTRLRSLTDGLATATQALIRAASLMLHQVDDTLDPTHFGTLDLIAAYEQDILR